MSELFCLSLTDGVVLHKKKVDAISKKENHFIVSNYRLLLIYMSMSNEHHAKFLTLSLKEFDFI